MPAPAFAGSTKESLDKRGSINYLPRILKHFDYSSHVWRATMPTTKKASKSTKKSSKKSTKKSSKRSSKMSIESGALPPYGVAIREALSRGDASEMKKLASASRKYLAEVESALEQLETAMKKA
jgi:hypothetical protein